MTRAHESRQPDFVRGDNLVAVLAARAEREPNTEAYVYLANGHEESHVITYAELGLRAQAVADRLLELRATGERVLLVFPPGLDFVVALLGCFLARAVAVPAHPPLSKQHIPRLEALVADAQARYCLTVDRTLPVLRRAFEHSPAAAKLTWIAIDVLPPAARLRAEEIDPDTLALLQYTSGSTGHPKGVVLTHGNLMANAAAIQQWTRRASGAPGVTWLPPYHDMGLMGGVIQPLYEGFRAVVMSPASFVQNPFAWLAAISKYRAVVGGGPNFAYALLADAISEEQKRKLDLSCWEFAFCGAEPISGAVVQRFLRAFSGCGFQSSAFHPAYGLAESTLLVTGKARGAPLRIEQFEVEGLEHSRAVRGQGDGAPARSLVSCGSVCSGQELEVVDPDTLLRAEPSRVGEIWVRGPSVARGYWNRSEETAARFRARLHGLSGDNGEDYYRTGDLGFLHEGELYLVGRLSDVIIINGRNYHPHDLERTAEASFDGLRPGSCIAFGVTDHDIERLVLVVELQRSLTLDASAARGAIRRAISAEYGVSSHDVCFVRRGLLPRTSSGKVRRRACKQSYLEGAWSSAERSSQP
jgi:acyl-CoA synthetase (AMP-forming)/AMP-acid ligase II